LPTDRAINIKVLTTKKLQLSDKKKTGD